MKKSKGSPVIEVLYVVVCYMKQLESGVARDDRHGAVCERVTCQVELLHLVQVLVLIQRSQTCQTVLGRVQHPQSTSWNNVVIIKLL